jgi:hypothetical protein
MSWVSIVHCHNNNQDEVEYSNTNEVILILKLFFPVMSPFQNKLKKKAFCRSIFLFHEKHSI